MTEWQPIETAPENEAILVWLAHFDGMPGRHATLMLQSIDDVSWWVTTDDMSQINYDWTPTKWTPLLEPPKETA